MDSAKIELPNVLETVKQMEAERWERLADNEPCDNCGLPAEYCDCHAPYFSAIAS